MKTLHFLEEPGLTRGEVSVVIRPGSKWSDARGQKINLCRCGSWCGSPGHSCPRDCEVFGEAQVLGTWNGPYDQIPARVIEQANPQLFSQLLERLKVTYTGFLSTENVTAIVLRP